ncbi:MAG: hypothetical protein QM796_13840 [Chthoniobacteraceae bacterium]
MKSKFDQSNLLENHLEAGMSGTSPAGKKIKVLVVDDSRVARQLLAHLLEADPKIAVAGAVGDGREALDLV